MSKVLLEMNAETYSFLILPYWMLQGFRRFNSFPDPRTSWFSMLKRRKQLRWKAWHPNSSRRPKRFKSSPFCGVALISALLQLMHTHKYLFSSWACPRYTFCVFLNLEKCTQETDLLKLESRGSNLSGVGHARPTNWSNCLRILTWPFFRATFEWFWFRSMQILMLECCFNMVLRHDIRHVFCLKVPENIGTFATDKVATFDLIFLEKRTTAALMLPKIGTFESKLRYKTAPHSAGSCCKNFPLGRTLQRKIIVF